MRFLYLIVAILVITEFASCKKDSVITSADATLFISADTLKFDTVFTTTGSVSQRFKIINTNKQKILLSEVKLMGAPSSPFQINVDGSTTDEVHDLEIEANDSIYVFVTVSINPTSDELPFIVSDSIRISYNGNVRFVQLQAYGQNANFLNNEVIQGAATWNSALPYVITGFVQIDTGASLNIAAGTKVYFHATAPMIIDGTLTVNGTSGNPVLFTGDRLDDYYRDLPGSWPGIVIRDLSDGNIFSYAEIKNAVTGIEIKSESFATTKLRLEQCKIDNALQAAIHATASSVVAENCLLTNSGYDLAIEGGGEYSFTHCTFATYSTANIFHTRPAVYLSNSTSEAPVVSGDLNAQFVNCIFWGEGGSVDSEIATDNNGVNIFTVLLDHCLYKSDVALTGVTLQSVIENQDPVFDSIDTYNRYFDFHISDEFSPVINAGTNTSLTVDLDGNNRNVGNPDLGSYEKQ